MIAKELEKKLGTKKRKTVSELKKMISTRSDKNPNFCLFLGAGASVSSGIRTAGQMITQWRDQVYCDLSGKTGSSQEEMKSWMDSNCEDWYDKKREYGTLIEKITSVRL